MDSRAENRTGTPSLLPILRSQQQGEILAAVLGAPDEEISVAELSRQTGAAYASVHREIERAESAGIVQSRRLGNLRLVKANSESPYFDGLGSALVRAFGPPGVLGQALAGIDGIESAYLFGSWAARYLGQTGDRPVHDLDLLVLGEPNRSRLFEATAGVSDKLGRDVQVTIREPEWLTNGDGPFHDTVVARPMVPIIDRHADVAVEPQ